MKAFAMVTTIQCTRCSFVARCGENRHGPVQALLNHWDREHRKLRRPVAEWEEVA